MKHRLALVSGFLMGLVGSLILVRAFPYVQRNFFLPIERIGIVGQYSPTTLPQSLQSLVSVGLTKVGPDGLVTAGLAQSWNTTDNGKTYEFFLRDDAYWHTGGQVKASDVNYNIGNVAFTAHGPKKITASLKQSYSPFPFLVSKPIFRPGLVGFGPYRVVAIRLKADIVQYLKLEPVVHNLPAKEFRFYQNQSQAIIAYRRGDVDYISELSVTPDILSGGNTRIDSTTHYDRVVALFFNTRQSRLSERSYRQALSHGVPTLNEEPAFHPFPKFSWVQADNIKKYNYDVDQVNRLLKNSQAASFSGELTISTFLPFSAVAETIAKSWTTLGIPSKVKIVNDISEGFDILLTYQILPPDPDQYPLWHSTQKDSNLTGYSNAKIDKLLEDGRREHNIEKRKKIYDDFARRLTDDVPVRLLYYPKSFTIRRIR